MALDIAAAQTRTGSSDFSTDFLKESIRFSKITALTTLSAAGLTKLSCKLFNVAIGVNSVGIGIVFLIASTLMISMGPKVVKPLNKRLEAYTITIFTITGVLFISPVLSFGLTLGLLVLANLIEYLYLKNIKEPKQAALTVEQC